MHPLVLPHICSPTVVVSPPAPTIRTGADCGTKMRLRLESAATECEPDDCGTVSIRTLVASITPRSEEHTSELQSRVDLVCRLLLDKKKKTKDRTSKRSTQNST